MMNTRELLVPGDIVYTHRYGVQHFMVVSKVKMTPHQTGVSVTYFITKGECDSPVPNAWYERDELISVIDSPLLGTSHRAQQRELDKLNREATY